MFHGQRDFSSSEHLMYWKEVIKTQPAPNPGKHSSWSPSLGGNAPDSSTSKSLQPFQLQRQKLVAVCAKPSSPAAAPLSGAAEQQLEIQLPGCKNSSVPFGIYKLNIRRWKQGKHKMENDSKLGLGDIVCIWLWFYLHKCWGKRIALECQFVDLIFKKISQATSQISSVGPVKSSISFSRYPVLGKLVHHLNKLEWKEHHFLRVCPSFQASQWKRGILMENGWKWDMAWQARW